MSASPSVSVVIPTFHRPGAVVSAARSALAQTFADLEVVVVVDGRDEATLAALKEIGDDRLHAVVPARNLGNAEARNFGIARSRGAWIGLLDDDDSWRPEKLERQLAASREAKRALPLVSCRFRADAGALRYVWPTIMPRADQPLSEYLFTRRRPWVEGVLQTSTFLAPRGLFEAVPFSRDLDRYVDLDWILRAAQHPEFELIVVPGEPLSVYSMDDGRARISNQADWRKDVRWIEARRDLVTRRAFGGYLLTQASIRAGRSRDRRAYLALLGKAVTKGSVSLGEVAFHTANTFLSPAMRRGLSGRGGAAVRR